MIAIKGIFDGHKIEATEPVPVHKRANVIITFLDEPIEQVKTYDVEDIAGCLKYNGPTISIEEMNDAIKKATRDSFK
jgi:hypothetical protein